MTYYSFACLRRHQAAYLATCIGLQVADDVGAQIVYLALPSSTSFPPLPLIENLSAPRPCILIMKLSSCH